jgi:hypothetical protein
MVTPIFIILCFLSGQIGYASEPALIRFRYLLIVFRSSPVILLMLDILNPVSLYRKICINSFTLSEKIDFM